MNNFILSCQTLRAIQIQMGSNAVDSIFGPMYQRIGTSTQFDTKYCRMANFSVSFIFPFFPNAFKLE